MSNTDAITVLQGVENPDTFVGSLCEQYGRLGNLSDKQWYWVVKLAGEVTDRAKRAADPAARVEVGDFGPMIDLFNTAIAAGKKFPKVRLQTDEADPQKVVIARCGKASAHEGKLRVTNGAGYNDPDNRYFGLIDTYGTFQPGRDATGAVSKLLQRFAADPTGVAAAYGKLTCSCCFCGRNLTDEKDGRSVDVGYGPVCAARHGLPWGN